MTTSLDVELAALIDTTAAVHCRRCGTPFPLHGDVGGPVAVTYGLFSPVQLTCPGFQWVDPSGPSPTYS